MDKKILYIAPSLQDITGGSLGRENNRNAIMQNAKCYDYFIPISDYFFTKVCSNILGYKAGLSFRHIRNIVGIIKQENISIVFIDISLYGKLVYVLKKNVNVLIISFFHNCEYLLYKQYLNTKRMLAKFLLSPVYKNEQHTLLYSDICIFLNDRDIDDCELIYNHKIENFMITPIALKDNYYTVSDVRKSTPSKLLFVGSYFYPNINGLVWFINNVLPSVDYTLTIVGKGFELSEFKKKLSNTTNIVFKGFVDSLTVEYENADIVIQPIFEGSGMKTKTAECFMYGKPIISTTEGIEGYSLDNTKYVYICNSSKDFITTLNAIKHTGLPSFVPELREIFIKKYSLDARKLFYKQLLEKL